MRVTWWAVALACLAGCGSGIGPHQPQVTGVPSGDPAPRTRPSMVYAAIPAEPPSPVITG